MSIENKARMFAELAHAGQEYNHEVPYPYHLQMVVDVLERFGFDDSEMICAGWLHDVIEDTRKSYNDILKAFGERVADLVFAVTSERGKNREDRNTKTYPKIYRNLYATALKLADRIANVEYGAANDGKIEMYRKEYPKFKEAIKHETNITESTSRTLVYHAKQVTAMWDYLDILMHKPQSA